MNWGLNEANDDQLKLVICAPQEKKTPVLDEFLNQLEGETTLIPTGRVSFQELTQHCYHQNGGLILVCLQSPTDLPWLNQALTKLEMQINLGTHKVIVYSELKNEKLNNSLRLRGVSEIVETGISLKAFQHKFNKVSKLVFQSYKKAQSDRRSKRITTQIQTAKALEKKQFELQQQTQQPVRSVKWVEPIENESDFWLVMNPKSARFVIGKWFINLVGPGPHLGEWLMSGETRNQEPGWIWTPRQSVEDPFHKDEGRWVFFGIMPEFSWEEKHWYFISKHPEFCYQRGSESLHFKMKVSESGDLEVASLSEASKRIYPLIQQSIESSIILNQKIEVKHYEETIEQADSAELSFVEKKSGKASSATDFLFKAKGIKKGWKDYQDSPPESPVYQGRFSEEFRERKDFHDQSYQQTRVGLEMTALNDHPVSSRVEIKMVELRERHVVLDVPASILVVNDRIQLDAYLEHQGVELRITVNAAIQIVETESDPAGDPTRSRSVAICALDESTAPQFVEIVKEIEKIKSELNEFFTKAKGVA